MRTEAFGSDFYFCNEKSYPNKKAYRKIESKEGVVKKCEQSICSATDNQQKCCNAKSFYHHFDKNVGGCEVGCPILT